MPAAVLLDINVLLDVILDRAPWADDATLLLDLIAAGRVRGFVSGHSLTTVHYIVAREKDRTRAGSAVSDLLDILEVVPLRAADFQRALALGLRDFEDAVQVAACLQAGADALVTRNARDFQGAPVTIRSAGEVVALIASTSR
ncbi:MAG TPA: PIN domain-containing protein [Gemmatimonadaceae bacterium]|nr:PIN domain-containing protein [Gemmatimonadaceae bacterium]